MADDDNDFAPLQAEFWLYAVRNPRARAILAAQERLARRLVSEVIASLLARAGAALDVRVDAMSAIVLAVFRGLATQRRVDSDSVPDQLFADAAQWLFSSAGISRDIPPGDHR